MKIQVSLGGYTNKYFCSKLSAIKYARKISKEKASNYVNWTQTSEVKTEFELISFKDGKKAHSNKIKKQEEFYY
jgi:hypothetical protein